MFTVLTPAEIAALAGFSIVTAFGVLWAISALSPRKTISARAIIKDAATDIVFVFDDSKLLDATKPARQLLATSTPSSDDQSDLDQLIAILSPRFPTIGQDLSKLFDKGQLTAHAATPDDTGRVEVEWWDNLARIAIVTSSDEKERSLMDGPSLNALTDELNILRETVDHAPNLVWMQDRDGTVTWANKSYTDLAIHHSDIENEKTWPLKALFATLPSLLEDDARRVWRACLKPTEDASPDWYEISSIQQGDHTLFFATDINATIKAEEALRDFVQTLSKTFAQLPTGLAIFDKKRQLVLFNPALLNMVGLSAEFLSIRPTLFAFLDKLRERQMVPEPKDYRSWQQQMSDLEAAAVDGTYSEVWNLPSGLTYRVTGRPHPGGGVAFLFDDISAEISLTRRFRSQLEQGQAVIDNLDEAIIVFASNGSVTLCNNKYKTLWAEDIVQEVVETNINDAFARWQLLSEDSGAWDQLRLFATSTNERSSWSGDVTLQNGNNLQCRAEALPRGATLIGFKTLKSEPPQLEVAVS